MTYGSRALSSALVLLLIVGLTGAPMIAGAQVTHGEPDLDVYLPGNELSPGTETTVAFQISNSGTVNYGPAAEQVTTARGVSFEIEDSGPFEVKTGETPIGPIQDGAVSEVTQRIVVPEDIEPGSYDIDVHVRYEYTNRVTSSSKQRLSGSDRQTITIRVPDEPRFAVSNVSTDVTPGASGDATFEIENTGTQTAYNAQATITGGGGVVVNGETGEEVLGTLEPSDTTRITVNAAIDEAVSEGSSKPLNVAVTYDDENGIEQEGDSVTANLAPTPKLGFEISNIEDGLRVGEEGVIVGTIENTGVNEVRSVTIHPVGNPATVIPREDSTTVGSFDPGESKSFRLPVEITGEAVAGEKLLNLDVQYRNRDGDQQTYDKLDILATIEPDRSEFELAIADQTITVGNSRTVSVEVTNNLDETMTDIEARLFADDPLSTAGADTSYIESLGPGESTILKFDVSAASAATAGSTYPMSFDLRYTDSDGNTHLSETFRKPLDAVPQSGGGLPIIPLLGVGLIIAGGVAFLYRRHR